MRTPGSVEKVKCVDMGEQEPYGEGSLVGCFRGLWCSRNGALEAVLGILLVGESKHRYLRGLLRKNCLGGLTGDTQVSNTRKLKVQGFLVKDVCVSEAIRG